VLEKHARIANPKIGRPAEADVFLQDFAPVRAHFAQIGITRKNHTFILRHWLCLSHPTPDTPNASSQRFVVQSSTVRIETGKLMKLHRRTTQYKATPIVRSHMLSGLLPRVSVSFVIFEDGLISEGEGVAIEMKIRRRCAAS